MDGAALPGTVEEDFQAGRELEFLSAGKERVNSKLKLVVTTIGNKSIGIRYENDGQPL